MGPDIGFREILSVGSGERARWNVEARCGKLSRMNEVVEIRTTEHLPGYQLGCGEVSLWFAQEVHALNHAQEVFPDHDIVIFDQDGNVKHRYYGQPSG
jgi:hypothetical protein